MGIIRIFVVGLNGQVRFFYNIENMVKIIGVEFQNSYILKIIFQIRYFDAQSNAGSIGTAIWILSSKKALGRRNKIIYY